MSKTDGTSADVVVVGSGLAGLTAAATAARAGKSVALFERSRELGGRAATQNEGGFLFNVGPHALYRRGAATSILAELGVTYSGKPPGVSGGFAVDGGKRHTLPVGFVSLITTSLLRLPAKFELARLLNGLARLESESLQHLTVNEWLARSIRNEEVRSFLRAIVRLTTYVNDPDRLSAGFAVHQLQLAFGSGVIYLDGGWQTLVEGLRRVATQLGVRIQPQAKVESVEADDAVRGVRLTSGERFDANAVVLTGGPAEVSALVRQGNHLPLRRWVNEAIAVRAACLDVGLSQLPQERNTFALGIDRPLYLSVHSAYARLGDDGTATIHVAKHLPTNDETDTRMVERELEGLLDLIQPGWRPHVRQRRFLPRMTVTHYLPTAAGGGTQARPEVEVGGIANLFVAGDWVGPKGHLADAALASGKRAGQLASGARAMSAAAA